MQILNIKGVFYEVDNNKILKDINIDVDQGDCISIVGLIRLWEKYTFKAMCRFNTYTKGDIYYRGKNYKEYNPLDLRKKISYCIQTPYLFGERVFENLEFPFIIRKESTNKNRISELLERFNLDEGILGQEIYILYQEEKNKG